MREDIKALIQKSRHCVMATTTDDLPYCSLMAYANDQDCVRIYMATHRHTRKFKNIANNPHVSLLIDSRETENPQALTIEGTVREIRAEADRQTAAKLLLSAHPSLNNFIGHPEATFICVRAQSAVFLNGLTDVHYEKIP